jgi:acyl-CoA thioesterase YciA
VAPWSAPAWRRFGPDFRQQGGQLIPQFFCSELKIMNDKRDPAIRITLLPRDTNSAGTIFGGVILSYIDMAGAIEAHRRTGMDRFVTVAMREVIFHKPVFVGDLVSFYAETVSIGNTSITIRVIVETERVSTSVEQVRVTEAEVVYVAVDGNRQKTKIVNRK